MIAMLCFKVYSDFGLLVELVTTTSHQYNVCCTSTYINCKISTHYGHSSSYHFGVLWDAPGYIVPNCDAKELHRLSIVLGVL